MKIVRVSQREESPFNLSWNLNSVLTETDYKLDPSNTIKFIEKLSVRHKLIRCSINVDNLGECEILPTIVDLFYKNGHDVSLTTRAIGAADYWKEIAEKFVWVGFVYNVNTVTDRYFEYLEITKHVARCGAAITLSSTDWKQCISVYERLILDDLHETSIYRDDTIEYTQDQREWISRWQPSRDDKTKHIKNRRFSNHGVVFHLDDGSTTDANNTQWWINNRLTNFKGYTCEIGLKSMQINVFGNIRPGNCSQGEIIGNISDHESLRWPESPVTCNANMCHSMTDVKINKWINK
jgi:hypothetical protein